MISDQNIAQLLEMGFTQEQSEDALTQSNNNVEDALTYLLTDGSPILDQKIKLFPQSEDLRNDDVSYSESADNVRTFVQQTDSTVSDFQNWRNDNNTTTNDMDMSPLNIEKSGNMTTTKDYEPLLRPEKGMESSESAPPNLPQRPNQYVSANSKSISGFLDDDLKRTLSSYVDHELTPASDIDRYSDYDIFSDISKHLRPDYLPPILIAPAPRLLEAYFAPLLIVLHEATSFRNLILDHDFQDYPFTKNWFKGERAQLKDDVSSRFIYETQRLIAFLDGDSERFFASTKCLTESFPSVLKEDLQNVETVDEFFTFVYDSYLKELRKTNDLVGSSFESLFHCKFNSSGESEVNASCFPIEFEQIRSNMYHSLHNIIIVDNVERDDSLNISQFSDLITIPILCPEDNYQVMSSQGIVIPEIFYPQIYSKNHSYVYDEVFSQLTELNNARQHILKVRQDLTSFRGQKVADSLKASLEALNSEIEDLSIKIELEQSDSTEKLAELTAAAKDLEQFCNSFQKKLEILRKEWLAINQKIESFDLVKEINNKMAEKEELYILIGAIFDESNFYYLTKDRDPMNKGENQWINLKFSTRTFHLRNSSFEEVEENVLSVSGNPTVFSTAIILLYCRKSCWNNDEIKRAVPTGLEKFLTEDRAYLHDMLKYVQDDDSSDSVEDAEEDEVEDYAEEESDINQKGFHELEDNLLEISPISERNPHLEDLTG